MKPNAFRVWLWVGVASLLLAGSVRWWTGRSGPPTVGLVAAIPANRVFFQGGLSCEGREQDLPLTAWQVTHGTRRLALTESAPPSVEVPGLAPGAVRPALTLRVPGWQSAPLQLPPPDDAGRIVVTEPIFLRRETAALAVSMPAGGTDYDVAEVVWVRALEDEPLALPLGRSSFVPLDFEGVKELAPLPTGIYRCTLKGRGAGRIRDFDLSAELPLQASGHPVATISLPPSLSRTYLGFAGFAADPQHPGSSIGFFCGLRIDLRKNTGDLLLAFLPLQSGQVLRYDQLKPRPDTVWPISNLFLEDPVRLAFDSPLSHAEHRLVLLAADGRVTLLPELIIPDDDRQRNELLGRMRTLIQAQARNASQRPEWFDPRYLRLPVQQLPNYENLLSLDHFTRYLGRLAHTAGQPIELGAELMVRSGGKAAWEVQVSAVADPAAPPRR